MAEIDKNTKIIFTMGMFFSLLGSLLGLFIGFYIMVISPQVKDVKDTQKDYLEHVIYFNSEIDKLNNSIGNIDNTITTINNRFSDLRNQTQRDTLSGGF